MEHPRSATSGTRQRLTGSKSFRYLLTDHRQFDMLESDPGWRGWNAIRSIETTRDHHAARRRCVSDGDAEWDQRQARRSHTAAVECATSRLRRALVLSLVGVGLCLSIRFWSR